MLNRSEWLKRTGRVVGACFAGTLLDVMARPARKRVMVAGQPATVVDIHAHCVVSELADLVPEARQSPLIIPKLLALAVPGRVCATSLPKQA